MQCNPDHLILEAQAAMCGLNMKQYRALDPEAQARVRRVALESNEEYTGPYKKSEDPRYKRRK